MKPLLELRSFVVWALALVTSACAAADFVPVSIRIDAAKAKGELRPIWRFFGADEPNYAYLPHGKKLLAELGELRPKQVYFRTHNLLTSGDGTPALKWGSTGAYAEDSTGQPIYNWTILDRIFDTYLERGVRPYVQIGFMPKDLSVKPDTPGAVRRDLHRLGVSAKRLPKVGGPGLSVDKALPRKIWACRS
jgi:xylan 1,4-beta-xylosidase